jgi:hypothetical protein
MVMSYAAHRREFGAFVSGSPANGETLAKRPGFLRRIFDAFMQSRQRDIDRQVARFLAARSGGTLTDDLEREISHRLSTSNWSLNASPYGERRFL